jgi:hypothetical protein
MYSVVANEVVDGGRLYADAVDRKPPLLFWTYATIITIAGKENWLALHLTALVWTLLTMAGLYCIARQMFDSRTGLAAAFLYCVFQPWATPKNLAFNGELMMNLPLVWGWAMVLGPERSTRCLELVAAGALLAAGFLLKQPAAIAAVPAGVYLLLPAYRERRGYTVAQSLIQAGLLTAGFFGTLGIVALILQAQGILAEAFYWTVTAHNVPMVFWSRAFEHTAAFVGSCLPLCVAAALSLRWELFGAARRAERMTLLLLVAVSIVGVAAGGRFYPHYYIQLVPPLALLAAPALTSPVGEHHVCRWLRPSMLGKTAVVAAAAFVIAGWIVLAAEPGPTESGRYIREHSSPDDRIFVWGQAPGIYLDAERRAASRYITSFALTGYIFGPPLPGVDTRQRIIPGAWTHLVEDLAVHPAAYIVDVQSDPSVQYPVEKFPTLAHLLTERYQLAARTAEGVVYRANDFQAR